MKVLQFIHTSEAEKKDASSSEEIKNKRQA